MGPKIAGVRWANEDIVQEFNNRSELRAFNSRWEPLPPVTPATLLALPNSPLEQLHEATFQRYRAVRQALQEQLARGSASTTWQEWWDEQAALDAEHEDSEEEDFSAPPGSCPRFDAILAYLKANYYLLGLNSLWFEIGEHVLLHYIRTASVTLPLTTTEFREFLQVCNERRRYFEWTPSGHAPLPIHGFVRMRGDWDMVEIPPDDAAVPGIMSTPYSPPTAEQWEGFCKLNFLQLQSPQTPVRITSSLPY